MEGESTEVTSAQPNAAAAPIAPPAAQSPAEKQIAQSEVNRLVGETRVSTREAALRDALQAAGVESLDELKAWRQQRDEQETAKIGEAAAAKKAAEKAEKDRDAAIAEATDAKAQIRAMRELQGWSDAWQKAGLPADARDDALTLARSKQLVPEENADWDAVVTTFREAHPWLTPEKPAPVTTGGAAGGAVTAASAATAAEANDAFLRRIGAGPYAR